jgi:hypothetical protein
MPRKGSDYVYPGAYKLLSPLSHSQLEMLEYLKNYLQLAIRKG